MRETFRYSNLLRIEGRSKNMGDSYWLLVCIIGSLAIMNFARCLGSGALTCFPYGSGSSTMDYILWSMESMDIVDYFYIPTRPIGPDHTYLLLSLHVHPPSSTNVPITTTLLHHIVHFAHDYDQIYSNFIYRGSYS